MSLNPSSDINRRSVSEVQETSICFCKPSLFITSDKARPRGEDVKRCRCGEWQRDTTGGRRSLTHTRWNGGRGYLRRGKWIGDKRFVSGTGQCTCESIMVTLMLRLIHRDRDLGTLGENVTTLDLKPVKVVHSELIIFSGTIKKGECYTWSVGGLRCLKVWWTGKLVKNKSGHPSCVSHLNDTHKRNKKWYHDWENTGLVQYTIFDLL